MREPSDAALLIDSHLHLWDRDRLEYPWMAGLDLPHTSLPGDPWDGAAAGETAAARAQADTAAEAGTAPAVLPAAVVVEAGAAAHQWDDEIAWVRGLAETHPHLRGMVAAVDYTAADLHERLARYAANDFVVGVRDNFEGLPAGELDVPARLAGVLAARRHGLTVDLCIRADQTTELLSLLNRVVAQRGDAAGIVLDHLGKPDVGGAADDEALRTLAAIPGLHVKISGLPPLAGGTVDATELERLVRTFALPAVTAFGPDRCMVGTDHPVSTVPHGLTRADWVRAVADALADAADELAGPRQAADLGAVLGTTAQRFYGV
jgi:L-fuconolactonase